MDSTTPPSFSAPPPLIAPRPATPPPRRWGWIIVSIILFLLLGLSVLMNLGSMFSGMANVGGSHHRAGGPRLDEVVVEEHRGSDKIAVVPVEGIISGSLADHGGYTWWM
jgi:hypothetical protein